MKHFLLILIIILINSTICQSQITITSEMQKMFLEEKDTGIIKTLESKALNTFIEFKKEFSMVQITNEETNMSAKIDEIIKVSETKDLYNITTITGTKYVLIVDQEEDCVILSTKGITGIYIIRYDVYNIF